MIIVDNLKKRLNCPLGQYQVIIYIATRNQADLSPEAFGKYG